MKMTFLRAGLLLLATTSVVRAAPLAPAAKPTGATGEPYIDAAAWRVVERAVAAYKNLRSYSGQLEVSTKTSPGVRWGGSPQRAIIAYKRPNKCNVVLMDDTGVWQSISDGQSIYTVGPHQRDRFLKTAVRSGRRNISGAFGWGDQLMTLGTGWFGMLADATDLQLLQRAMVGSWPGERAEHALTLGVPGVVNGTPIDTVIATSKRFARKTGEAKARWRTGRFVFSFGKSDGLLRRFVIEGSRAAGEPSIVTTETHSGIAINTDLAESLFRFTPTAATTRAVNSERELWPQRESQEPMFDPRLQPGAAPFPFTATDVQGQKFSLEDYKGKVLLLDFWAMWCGPCVGEIPETRIVYNTYKDQGFEIVSISLDEAADRAKLADFVAKEKMTWRHVFDGQSWQGELARLYGVRAIPCTVLLGRDGKIAAVDMRGSLLEHHVKAALQKP